MFYKSLVLLSILAEFVCASRKPVLLVSFDGFQSGKFEEFIAENPNNNFSRIIKNGLKSDFMTPSFPSFTFPNHVTLITGLYPESHGIVSNTVYDPNYNEKIKLSTTDDLKWWNKSEPIWFTAKQQGLKTASSFWVSNNIWPRQPDIFLNFNPNYDPFKRIDELINWYNKFDLDFVCIYFDQPDLAGHFFGPDSKEYKEKIVYVDSLIGYMLNELERINILKDLNVVVVSDHGMAKMDKNQFVYIQDYVDPNLIDFDKSVIAILSNIFPKTNDKLNELYEQMQKIPNHKVFLKTNMPEEFNYTKSDRIGPIVALSDEGYRLMSENYTYIDYGAHGFLNNLTSMRAIFMAQGPNFKNGRIGSFQNVNIYPLICKLLEIKCNPNNGSTEIFEPYLIASGSLKLLAQGYYSVYFVLFTVFILAKIF